MRIYRYIVRHDAGTAPNPFDGWCTLAICKPAIRRTASVGDWIVGFHAAPVECGHVLYAMQVKESIDVADYWRDVRFDMRKPSATNLCPDNIYTPVRLRDGSEVLQQVPNRVHDKSCVERDLSGKRVLVSRRFWYFGKRSIEADKRLIQELLHLAPKTQGHVVDAHRKPDDIALLEKWLSQFPGGRQGTPSVSTTNCGPCVPITHHAALSCVD